jgi:hypothetical protein
MPESVSHDWHVQPSCQRPNRGPPRRREFSPGGFSFVSKPTSANPTVLETLQTYSAAQNPVNRRIPQDFQMISTSGIRGAGARERTSGAKARIQHETWWHPSVAFARSGQAQRLEVVPFPVGDGLPNRWWAGRWALEARNSMCLPFGMRRQFRRAHLRQPFLRQAFLRQPRRKTEN